jgi:hypothetical protein
MGCDKCLSEGIKQESQCDCDPHAGYSWVKEGEEANHTKTIWFNADVALKINTYKDQKEGVQAPFIALLHEIGHAWQWTASWKTSSFIKRKLCIQCVIILKDTCQEWSRKLDITKGRATSVNYI